MNPKLHSVLFYSSGLRATYDFYKKLGFAATLSEDGVRIEFGDVKLAFIDENQTPIKNESGKTPKGLGVYIYIKVDNVDEYYESIKKNGIEPRTEPRDWPWGKREFVAKDPDGYKLVFFNNTK